MNISFTLLDWSLLLVFLVSTILGIMKGLVRELFALGFLIFGAALAYRLAPSLGRLLGNWIKQEMVARFLAFVLILVLVVIFGIWATWLVKKVFLHGALTFLDRLLGGILGALRGFLLGCVLLLAMFQLPAGQSWINRSCLASFVFAQMRAVAGMLPGRIEKKIDRYINHAKQENRGNRGTI